MVAEMYWVLMLSVVVSGEQTLVEYTSKVHHRGQLECEVEAVSAKKWLMEQHPNADLITHRCVKAKANK